MVSGDLNAALVEWVVQYRLDDPQLYLFHAREPGCSLRDLSEAVMRETVGDRTVDEVITIGRQEVEDVTLKRMRESTKEYRLGITVDQVQLKNVNPLRDVQSSFNEVNKAKQDRENAINVANGEYNKAVPRAEGEALRILGKKERDLREIEPTAYRQVQELQGSADAEATRICADAFNKSPQSVELYGFIKSMDTYRKVMAATPASSCPRTVNFSAR